MPKLPKPARGALKAAKCTAGQLSLRGNGDIVRYMSRWTQSDPYVVLGLSSDASLSEVKAAYRRLAKELHPDSHGRTNSQADAAFDAVTAAYDKICRAQGRARNAGGPLLSAPLANDSAETVTKLRPLGGGVEAQVLTTARLRPYYRQLPHLAAAAYDLRQGSIAVLRPTIVELFRRSTFGDDEAGVRALVANAAQAMMDDEAVFSAVRARGMGADALALLAEAIICEAAVQQHEGEMILDGQFFSAVVQSRLALLVRRAEMVIRQLLAHPCMTSASAPPTDGKPKATPTSSGFAVLE